MVKNIKRIVILLLLVLTLVGSQAVSAELLEEDIPEAIEIIRLINEYRIGLGLWPYTFDQKLAFTAQGHSEYQAAINSEGTHVGEGGTTSTDRARAQGYNIDIAYFRTDEMIYNGYYATPQKSFDWWKDSPIHNAIMMSDVYHEIGIGIAHTEEGRKYYTVNVGMIPNVTVKGSTSYRAPSPEEYKTSESASFEPEDAGTDGSLYHPYKEGQTLTAIAAAYAVSVDRIRSLNGLSEGQTPTDGQLLIILLPTEVDTPTPLPTQPEPTNPAAPPPEPSATPEPTEMAAVIDTPAAEQPKSPSEGDLSGGDESPPPVVPQPRNLVWLWMLLAVLFIAVGAGYVFWYLPRLRKTVARDGFDLERWLMDDLEKEKAGEAGEFTEPLSTTTEFDNLPRQQQATLLQHVAIQALDAYSLQVESVQLMRYVLNAEFVVEACPEDQPDTIRKYVLRVNAPNFNARAEIDSEMTWLDAMNRDTRLSVPVPVRTSKGDWVATIDHPRMGIFRHCVLFEYLEAAAAEETITPSKMEFLGAMIGLIHRHGASFDPPPGFVRKHWDLEGLRGEMLDVPITQALAALDKDERAVLREAEELVATAMERLGSGPQVYGLIHGDLHLKSLIFSPDGRPAVIDFDTCGWGYYVYDLAVAVWNIFHRDDFSMLRDALLAGYRKVRPLSLREETHMIYFVAGRLMIQVLTWAPRRANETLAEAADKAIERELKQLSELLKILKE